MPFKTPITKKKKPIATAAVASKNNHKNNINASLAAFGSNYYHALGGTTPVQLKIPFSENNTNNNDNHKHDSTNDHGDQHDDAAAAEIPQQQQQQKLQAHEPPPPQETVMARCHAKSFLESSSSSDYDVEFVESIACSSSSTIFLTNKGIPYQVGYLHGLVFPSPTKVTIPLPLKCVEIAAGRHFCIGRMEGGMAVVSWGAGHFGQLGLGPHISASEHPKVIERLLPHHVGGSPITQVAAGSWHALALTQEGRCFGWGSNRRYQCGIREPDYYNNNYGNGGSKSSSSNNAPPTVVYPHPVDTSVVFSKVTCGKSHSVGLERETGRVYTWGASHHGQCGHPTRRSSISPPRLVDALSKVVAVEVAAGDSHTLALTGGGRVFAWGSGLEGQLGLGPAVPLARPKLIADLDFVAIDAGQEWKKTTYSTAGTNTQQQQQQQQQQQYTASPTPSKPTLIKTTKDDGNTIGSSLPPLLPLVDSSTTTTGTNTDTPSATTQQHESPQVPQVPPKIVAIDAAGSYSVAISSAGHLYTWGYNDWNVLGLPQPSSAELSFVEPPNMNATRTSGRMLQVKTFDSRHNVLLPKRVDALADQTVLKVSAGRSHLWTMCRPRLPSRSNNVTMEHYNGVPTSITQQQRIGRTLYEVQEERRQRSLVRLRKHIPRGSGHHMTNNDAAATTTTEPTAPARNTGDCSSNTTQSSSSLSSSNTAAAAAARATYLTKLPTIQPEPVTNVAVPPLEYPIASTSVGKSGKQQNDEENINDDIDENDQDGNEKDAVHNEFVENITTATIKSTDDTTQCTAQNGELDLGGIHDEVKGSPATGSGNKGGGGGGRLSMSKLMRKFKPNKQQHQQQQQQQHHHETVTKENSSPSHQPKKGRARKVLDAAFCKSEKDI